MPTKIRLMYIDPYNTSPPTDAPEISGTPDEILSTAAMSAFEPKDETWGIQIGRATQPFTHPPTEELILMDPNVSRYHARIMWEASRGAWQIEDIGSKNGTRLDGRKLLPRTPQPLRDGSEIKLGDGVEITIMLG